VPYKQALLGIGWAAPTQHVSTFAFDNLAGDFVGGKAVFVLGDPSRRGDGNNVRHITPDYLSRDARLLVLAEWIGDSMNSNHEALVVLRGTGCSTEAGMW
jgi:hypothetical protein